MILIVLTMSLWSEFTQTGDIITDTTTGLQWEDDSNISILDPLLTTGSGYSYKRYTWSESLAYCEQLGLGGYHDWRLPNVNELSLLLGRKDKFYNGTEYDSWHAPYHNKRFFWTSTSNATQRGLAYAVDTFYTLDIALFDKSSAIGRRCVRGGD